MLKKGGMYLITLLIMSTMLISCGSSSTQSQAEKESPVPTETEVTEKTDNDNKTAKWYQVELVDEFGDPVKNAEPVIAFPITGTFSNTATTASPLSGIIYITNDPSSDKDWTVGLQLYEYDGKNRVSYLDSSEIKLLEKVKHVDNGTISNVTEFQMIGQSPNGDLILSDYRFNEKNWWPHGGAKLISHLEIPGDVHLILQIDSSSYDFWVYYSNFDEVKGLVGIE